MSKFIRRQKNRYMALLDFRAVCMPYCIKKVSPNTYIVLNREYQPIGFNTYNNKIDKLPVYMKTKSLTKNKIDKILSISKGACLQEDSLFLYNDETNPLRKNNRHAYFEILDILMELKVDNQ